MFQRRHAAYLIEVVEGQEPKLLGPYDYHLDTRTPWILEAGWQPCEKDNPRWVRGKDKLYRVTLPGIIQLVQLTAERFPETNGGYITEPVFSAAPWIR